jgi:hypothetical protein
LENKSRESASMAKHQQFGAPREHRDSVALSIVPTKSQAAIDPKVNRTAKRQIGEFILPGDTFASSILTSYTL